MTELSGKEPNDVKYCERVEEWSLNPDFWIARFVEAAYYVNLQMWSNKHVWLTVILIAFDV